MKPTALIVNAMRAPLIADGALAEALRRGRSGFAAVDVYEDELLIGPNHALLKLPNAVCTPHLGKCRAGNTRKVVQRRTVDLTIS